ncbi:shikimate kinase [Methanolapillus ohkumae]
MIQKGYGCAFGGGTIINAIASKKGSAFATEMKTYAQVIISDSKNGNKKISGRNLNDPDMNPYLMERCVELVLERFDCKKTAEVWTKSDIPAAGGLKSSSAAANACVMAALDALGIQVQDPDFEYKSHTDSQSNTQPNTQPNSTSGLTIDPLDVVKLGVSAAKDAKVTITGAFDDACASFFGGVVLTDNSKMHLLKREEFHYDVLILSPDFLVHSSQTNVQRSVLMKDLVDIAFDLASAGLYEKAMKLNGLLYCAALGFDPKPAVFCMEAGQNFGIVSGLSGTGPSFTALFPPTRENETQKSKEILQIRQNVKEGWNLMCPKSRIFETKTCNRNAVFESSLFSEKMKLEKKDLINCA